MDLLGDLGASDQLSSARTENAVLRQKVDELTAQVRRLTIDKAALQAEVELYRSDATVDDDGAAAGGGNGRRRSRSRGARVVDGSPGHSAASTTTTTMAVAHTPHSGSGDPTDPSSDRGLHFVTSGHNGVVCSVPEVRLPDGHGTANPVCVTLSSDETAVISGGANGTLRITQWGAAAVPAAVDSSAAVTAVTDTKNTTTMASVVPVQNTATLSVSAPVICVATAPSSSLNLHVIAAGTMDGRVHLVVYESRAVATIGGPQPSPQLTAVLQDVPAMRRHTKYLTAVAWSSHTTRGQSSSAFWQLLATSSADGDIHVYKVSRNNDDDNNDDDDNNNNNSEQASKHRLLVQHWQSFHFESAVTSLCFCGDQTLYAYIRGTPHLTVLHPSDEGRGQISKVHLNASATDDHVSFAVLCLRPSPDHRYLAAATDHHRHLILDVTRGTILRHLYGHAADDYSTPVVAWSACGQYLYSNTQDAPQLLVYEIASGRLRPAATITTTAATTDTMPQPHTRPIKDMYSCPHSDLLVTTSFDRQTVVWFPKQQ